MTMIKATTKGGRLAVDVPRDWPDGTEVEICPLGPGTQDDAEVMSAKDIAQTLAAMDQLEPLGNCTVVSSDSDLLAVSGLSVEDWRS